MTEGISEDDFKCGICLELIVDPTTLTCGHTLCRSCVAQWWHKSKKCTCPECQQVWHGFPQINFTLRNTINSLFPKESAEREQAMSQNAEFKKVIDLFNSNANEDGDSNVPNNRNWSGIFLIVAITIGVLVVITVGARKLSGKNDIMSKSHHDWSPEDVKLWVGGLGLWSKVYAERFAEAGIDGILLMQLKDVDLQSPPINMGMGLHRRTFMERREEINKTLSLYPSGLWEYKERKSGMAVFIMLGIREFPRSTLAYLYLFNYADTFLPIFHATLNRKEEIMEDSGEPMTWADLLLFLPRLLFLPYYLVLRFASHYLEVNYWTSRVVMMHAALMTLAEFTNARSFFSTQLKKVPYLALKHMLYVCLLSLVIKLVWPFVPFFIADCVFYWFLYVSPFDALNRLRKRLSGRRIENN